MDGEVTFENAALDWVADPAKINYTAVPCISVPCVETDFSLYNAALNAFFLPYRTGYMNGQPITSKDMVKQLAANLAEQIDRPSPDSGKTYYSTLHGGKLGEISSFVQKYSLDGMRRDLLHPHVGCAGGKPESVTIEYLAASIRIGILVLDALHHDVCLLDCEQGMKDYETTFVLLYHRADAQKQRAAHFTLVMLQPGGDELGVEALEELSQSLFTTSHPFIQALHARAEKLKMDKSQLLTRR